jgi:hypothetical protein
MPAPEPAPQEQPSESPAPKPKPEPVPEPEPMLEPEFTSGEIELKYDDGKGECHSSCSGQYGFAVRYSPPTTPFDIKQVGVFTSLYGTGHEDQTTWFDIRDHNFETLYSWSKPAAEFPTEPDWIISDLPDTSVTDDFYIVFYPCSMREGGVYLHYDTSQENTHSEMAEQGGKIADWIWEFPEETTNWMIRVIGESTDEVMAAPPQEFQETVKSLDNPEKLSQWMIDNIQVDYYDYERYKETGINDRLSPDEIFETKLGCCAEFATFACYVLQFHGYQAKILAITIESDERRNHAVCIYQLNDSIYKIDNGRIGGPYQTYEDIALEHDKAWSSYTIYYSWEKYTKFGPADKAVYYRGSVEFKEAISLLDTPEKVSSWVEQNIGYKGEDVNEYAPAWVIFKRGYDDCDGFATIQSYFLKANGYDAWNIGIAIETPYGHNVCGYKENDKWLVLDNNGIMRGPFESLEQLADEVGNIVRIPKGSSIYLIDPFDIVSTTSFPKYQVYRE